MIYLEYIEVAGGVPVSHGVELSASTIAEAARLFLAFEEGVRMATNTRVEMTSIGTAKRRGVSYEKWSGL